MELSTADGMHRQGLTDATAAPPQAAAQAAQTLGCTVHSSSLHEPAACMDQRRRRGAGRRWLTSVIAMLAVLAACTLQKQKIAAVTRPSKRCRCIHTVEKKPDSLPQFQSRQPVGRSQIAAALPR